MRGEGEGGGERGPSGHCPGRWGLSPEHPLFRTPPPSINSRCYKPWNVPSR